jgi:hypothetical protein
MTPRFSFVLVLVAVALAAGPGASAQSARPRELSHVKQLGAALAEYDNGSMHAVAAYYYSQRNHDSRWLLIEIGINSQRLTNVSRDRIELATPTGDVVPLSGQRRWVEDGERAQRLFQQVRPTRHQVASYFREIADISRLRFFTAPGQGGTVIDDIDTASDQILLGDLLFESPTGLWERGRYVLAIGHNHGVAELPIDLR